MKKSIVLCTCNARYSHCSLALRLLQANLGLLKDESVILECQVGSFADVVAEEILSYEPSIVCFSTYIWNVDFARSLVMVLKRVAPWVVIVLGGPEVVDVEERDDDRLFREADYYIIGEGEEVLGGLCLGILGGECGYGRVIRTKACDLSRIERGYSLYSAHDIAHRVIYVESSRGCPFRCSFCLSAEDKPVRFFPMDKFLEDIDELYARGVRQFKFLDRTLNSDLGRACNLLEHFLSYGDEEIELHFEMVPQRLSERLIVLLSKFGEGKVQLEIGVQSLNSDVAAALSRPLRKSLLLENLSLLRERTGVHIHSDLIAGLPLEDEASFCSGFDTLYETGVQEIQVGILKCLRGSPLSREAKKYGLVFSTESPYEILHSPGMDFGTLMRIKRFSKVWDIVANSGNFVRATRLLCSQGSAYRGFMGYSEWLCSRCQIWQGVSLVRQVGFLFEYFSSVMGYSRESVAMELVTDYLSNRKEDIPVVLRPYVPKDFKISSYTGGSARKGRDRQNQHIQGGTG